MRIRLSTAPAAIASAGALAVLLAGCGGSGSTPAQGVMPQSNTPLQSTQSSLQNTASRSAQSLASAVTPDLTAYPNPLVFTAKGQLQVQINPNSDFYAVKKNFCKKPGYVAKIHYFDYGIFQVTPGKVNTPGGSNGPGCLVVIADTITHATVKLYIIVNIPGQ